MQIIKRIYNNSGKEISVLIEETSKHPLTTLIEIHGGFIGSKEKTTKENSELINWCEKNNTNYIAIDLSNNGTQKDQPINELRFSDRVKDVESVIDFVVKKYNSSIILIGSSLGGLIVLNTGLYSPLITGVILNCAAVKAHECVKNLINEKEFANWKNKRTANVWGVPMKYDFYEDLISLDATKIIPQLNIPILWFHGTKDEIVPINQAKEAKKINSKIELIEIIGGKHRFGDKMKAGEWEKTIEAWIPAGVYPVGTYGAGMTEKKNA